MKHRYLIGFAFFASLGACDCDDGEGGIDDIKAPPQIVIQDEGTGSTNTEPLWKLSPGFRIGESAWVLPPVEVSGQQVLPLGTTERGPSEAHAAPNEPAWWMYFSQDSEGNVWYHGAPREGLLEEAALFVPATVRKGMRWNTSFYPGGDYFNFPDRKACTNRDPDLPETHSCSEYPRFTVEVIDGAEMDTIYGERMVWTLQYTDWRRYIPAYEFPGYPDEEIWDGVGYTVQYVEGRGPLSIPGIYQAQAQGGLVPLEDFAMPAALPRITLTDKQEVGDPNEFLGVKASAYLDPDRGDEPLVVAHGLRMSVAQMFGPGGETSIFWNSVGSDLCFQGGEPAEDCNSGHGVTVSADKSQFLAIDMYQGGTRVKDGFMYGLFEGPNGQMWGVGKAIQNKRAEDGLPIGAPNSEPAIGPVLWNETFSEVHFVNINNPLIHVRQRGNVEGFGRFDEAVWADLNQGKLRILEDSHRLDFFGWDLESQTPTNSSFQYPAVMDVNVTTNAGEKVMLLSEFQGRIDRVHLRDDGIEIEPLGDVELPDGHFLTGATLVGDELIVFTQTKYTGIDIWFDLGLACPKCTGLERNYPPRLGTTFMWKAQIPSGSEAARPSAVFGVTTAMMGYDVRVCWPAGHDEPSLDGWTLGGFAPRAVTVVGGEDRCVLLSRDMAIPDLLTDSSSWVIEGPIPGYGRVAIGLGRQVEQPSDCGRFGCGHEHSLTARLPQNVGNFDPGLGGTYPVVDASLELALSEALEQDIARIRWDVLAPEKDLRSDGVWIADSFNVRTLYFDGESIEVFPQTDMDPRRTNGGAMNGTVHVSVDGTETPLPAGVQAPIRLSNGTVCGIRNESDLVCIDQDGNEVAGPAVSLERFAQAWIDTDDHIYLIDGRNVEILAPDATVSSIDTVTLSGFEVDLDDTVLIHSLTRHNGQVFALLTVNHLLYSEHAILKFAPAGVSVIHRAELQNLAYLDFSGATQDIFTVDDGFFMIGVLGGDSGLSNVGGYSWQSGTTFLRIPREGDASRPYTELIGGGGGCVPIDDIEMDVLTELQRSILGQSNPMDGPNRFICTTLETSNSAELFDQDGRPVTGANNFGNYKRYANLPANSTFTLRDIADERVVEEKFVTGVAGQNLVFDLSGLMFPEEKTLENGYLGVVPGTCVPSSQTSEEWDQCAMHSAFDPTDSELVVEIDGDVFLIRPDLAAVHGASIQQIPVGGHARFTPDGTFILSDGDAWSTTTDIAVSLPADRDLTREPVFALPEHPLVFLTKLDGTGVVVRWDSDAGTITEVLTTAGALDAAFSGNGLAVVVLEPAQSDVEIARYDLATQARTVIATTSLAAENIETNVDGTVVYGNNNAEMTPRGFVATQTLGVSYLTSDLIGNADYDFAMSNNRYGTGGLFLTKQPDNSIQGYRVDENAIDTSGLFVPVGALTLAPFAIYPVKRMPASFVTRTQNPRTISFIDASDGNTLMTMDGEYKVQLRNDGKVAVAESPCQDVDCRVITILSEDQSRVVETIDNNAAPNGAPWPYGAFRARTDAPEDGAPHWRHMEPIGLDMPCMLHQRGDDLWCQ